MPTFTLSEAEDSVQLDLFDVFNNEDRHSIVRLYEEGLSKSKALVIYDTAHFARLCGYAEEFLFAVSASPSRFYREFNISKSAGGKRLINEPLPTLKQVQRYIIDRVLVHVEPHKSAKAFRKHHTLRGPAIIHKSRPYMLRLDVKDFFPSIDSFAVYRTFYDLGYTKQISRLFSGICTLQGALPQGAPTSPMISNLYLRGFDAEIFRICLEKNIFYTRYADDMTFSSNDANLLPIIAVVRENLKQIGLRLNPKKTSYSRLGARKYVNGVVVNEKPNVLKSERADLRQIMYYIRKFGIHGHLRRAEIRTPNYLDHIIGRLTFAHFITREPNFLADANYIRNLKSIL